MVTMDYRAEDTVQCWRSFPLPTVPPHAPRSRFLLPPPPRLASPVVEPQRLGRREASTMSALFNFNSFLTVVLLVICTCTYIKMQFPAILNDRTGFRGFFWKAARIGERLSPWVSFGCLAMGISTLFF
uniref:Protein kish n=10 Tax=Paniceae TaxID=147428 RepID=K3ZAR8_SETIT